MSQAQVLVVEDETIIAKGIQCELRGMGYQVPAIAGSAQEAVELAQSIHPDVILMDVVLRGDRDGIMAAEEVRHRFDIPVVFLTAYGDEATLQRARCAEPYGYLIKPYEEQELRTTIEVALYKHQLEQQLKATLQGISDAVLTTDGSQAVKLMNQAAEQLCGVSRGAALGKELVEVCKLWHPYQRTVLAKLIGEAVSASRPLPLPDDVVLVGGDGGSVPVEGSVSPIHDATGNYSGLVVTLRDISARRQMEKLRRDNERQLLHSQKMEAITRLAGGVAHQFNNALTVILGHASLLLADMPADHGHAAPVTEIEKAALQAADIVRQLLAFSGQTSAPLEVVDLNELVGRMLDAFQSAIDPRLAFQFLPAADLWKVLVAPNQVASLLRSLCLHCQATLPDGGLVVIQTANLTLSQEQRQGRRRSGDFVCLSVRDSGGLIAAPKDGLDLALLQGLAEEQHGWLESERQPGRGNRYAIYLPRFGETLTPAAAPTLTRLPQKP